MLNVAKCVGANALKAHHQDPFVGMSMTLSLACALQIRTTEATPSAFRCVCNRKATILPGSEHVLPLLIEQLTIFLVEEECTSHARLLLVRNSRHQHPTLRADHARWIDLKTYTRLDWRHSPRSQHESDDLQCWSTHIASCLTLLTFHYRCWTSYTPLDDSDNDILTAPIASIATRWQAAITESKRW